MSRPEESQETHAGKVGGAAKNLAESPPKASTFPADFDIVRVRYEALLRLLFEPDADHDPYRQDAA